MSDRKWLRPRAGARPLGRVLDVEQSGFASPTPSGFKFITNKLRVTLTADERAYRWFRQLQRHSAKIGAR